MVENLARINHKSYEDQSHFPTYLPCDFPLYACIVSKYGGEILIATVRPVSVLRVKGVRLSISGSGHTV